ncbi:MAG TPA: energy-coupling factor ABC transporter permease [Bryobacteraceae bacterium]|nr:energy-coupling factor ABC transporter permease [Bryobacteraceae bacterium]
MHIPDNFLSTPVWASLDALSVPAVGLMIKRAGRDLPETRIPLLGVMGAFVFAAQMINFPVGAGTSGHLVGAALLAAALGPAPAALVMTTILVIQAFVFQDGGVLSLGANVLNMAIAGVLAGYLPFQLWGASRRSAAIFAGGFLSVLVSGSLALSELLISGVRMPRLLVFTSLGLFAVNALVEGAITISVVQALDKLNPGFVQRAKQANSRMLVILGSAGVLLGAAGFLLASNAPDAIQNLGQTLGISAKSGFQTPMANYTVGNFESAWLRRAIAGLTGLLLIAALCVAGARMIGRRRSA